MAFKFINPQDDQLASIANTTTPAAVGTHAICDFIFDLRNESGLSREEFAKQANTHKNTVDNIENHRTPNPSAVTLDKMLASLGYRLAAIPDPNRR